MRIVYDFESILKERHSGFFTYGAGLLAGLAALDDGPDIALFCTAKTAKNVSWLGNLVTRCGGRVYSSRIKSRWLEKLWGLSWPRLDHWTGDFDLYHSCHHLMPPTGGRPRVLTVHDLRRYRFPQFYPHSKVDRFERAVNSADHIIAISQATKNDLLAFFDLSESKISVVYHGGLLKPVGDIDMSVQETMLDQLGIKAGRYFIAFSSYDQRKNIGAILRGFDMAQDKLDDDYRLVVVGQAGGKEQAEWLEPLSPRGRHQVVFTGRVDDCAPLLQGARGLVFASLYEGFGLPLVEAMSVGTPVIASNSSSLPEVVDKAGLLVDPGDIDSISQAMVRLAGDNALYAELVGLGHERVQYFTWEKTAQQTLAVYEQVL